LRMYWYMIADFYGLAAEGARWRSRHRRRTPAV
jgi:hypothetical protein